MADEAVEEVIRRLLSPSQAPVGGGGNFQASYDQAMREIGRSRSGINNLQQLQTNRINTDFGIGEQRLGEDKGQTLKALMDRLAGQGIARSGINIEEQGNVQQEFQRALQELTFGKTRGLEDLQQNVMAGLQDLTNREEELKIQKAQYDAQKALESAQSMGGGFSPTGNFSGGGSWNGAQWGAPQPIAAPPAPVQQAAARQVGINPNIYQHEGTTTTLRNPWNGTPYGKVSTMPGGKVRNNGAW